MKAMVKKSTILSVITLLLIMSLPANSVEAQSQEDMRIGFVEPRAILERMPEMRAVQQRIQNFAERKSEELAQMERELQQQIESYQQTIGVISDQARQQEEERLGELDLELRQSQTQAQQELAERRAELMEPLLNQIQTAINEVAQERGIDYVLNLTTSTGDVIILYVRDELREEYDITDAVMRNLGI